MRTSSPPSSVSLSSSFPSSFRFWKTSVVGSPSLASSSSQAFFPFGFFDFCFDLALALALAFFSSLSASFRSFSFSFSSDEDPDRRKSGGRPSSLVKTDQRKHAIMRRPLTEHPACGTLGSNVVFSSFFCLHVHLLLFLSCGCLQVHLLVFLFYGLSFFESSFFLGWALTWRPSSHRHVMKLAVVTLAGEWAGDQTLARSYQSSKYPNRTP